MIVPKVSESGWLNALSSLPAWLPPEKPILVIAPHPDDETLGAGGFIAAQRARGIDVSVVAVTDGENAYPDCEGLGQRRRIEQEDALARLNVPIKNIIRLELPDSAVCSQANELEGRLSALVSENTHVIAPWRGDFHPDHQACGRAAEQVTRDKGATLTSYFFWTWHFGEVDLLKDLNLRAFSLRDQWLVAKGEALQQHRSQLVRSEGQPPILPELLLAPARRRFEVFAIS
jgi:LmbE family N-acetylglucosaminyl deacetylase